jgi:hypothetical protein
MEDRRLNGESRSGEGRDPTSLNKNKARFAHRTQRTPRSAKTLGIENQPLATSPYLHDTVSDGSRTRNDD